MEFYIDYDGKYSFKPFSRRIKRNISKQFFFNFVKIGTFEFKLEKDQSIQA